MASTISASVRYLSDGASCAWPIPFPFGNPAEVGASVIEDGAGRDLEYGKDYLISNNCVMAIVPKGAAISIWLKTSMDAAIDGARAKALSVQSDDGPVYEPEEEETPSIESAITSGLDRLQRCASDLQAMLMRLLNAEAEKLRIEFRAAAGNAQNAAESAISAKAEELGNVLGKKAESGVATVNTMERSAIDAIDKRGFAYLEEMAGKAQLADGIVLKALDIETSVNAQAQGVQTLAENLEGAASAAFQDSQIARASAKDAWQAAWQASTMANRPGIGTIGKLTELDKSGSGHFVINGRVVHTPTMFFGLWPVDCPCCAAWDGFFVIGPAFPDDPVLPPYPLPAEPGKPADPANPGNPSSVGGALWGSCIHHGNNGECHE